jgi:cell division septum initiation protein DivIVA
MRGQVAVTAKTLGIWPDVIQDERRKPDPRQLREMADLIEKMAVERGKLLSDVSERIDLIKDLTLENTDLRDMASRLESELREAWSKIDSARVDLEGLMSGDQISGTFITEAEAEERIQEEIRDYIPEEFNPERLDG